MSESNKAITKSEKFIVLAEKRVNKALKEFELIGNLGNRSNYEYSADQADKIIKALSDGLKELKGKFSEDSSNRGDRRFKL